MISAVTKPHMGVAAGVLELGACHCGTYNALMLLVRPCVLADCFGFADEYLICHLGGDCLFAGTSLRRECTPIVHSLYPPVSAPIFLSII